MPMPLDLWQKAKEMKVPPNAQTLTKIFKETGIERFKNHSWRSGFKQLSRDVGLYPVLGEALMCHSLGKLEETYGDGFADDNLLEGAEKVWRQVEECQKGTKARSEMNTKQMVLECQLRPGDSKRLVGCQIPSSCFALRRAFSASLR